MQKLISLITDYGYQDGSIGILKSAILRQTQATVIDFCHDVAPGNITQAAYFLDQALFYLPENSIHIVGVNANFHPKLPPIVAKVKNQYVLTSDNGLLNLISYEIEWIKKINFLSIKKSLMLEVLIPTLAFVLNEDFSFGENVKLCVQLKKNEPIFKKELNTLFGNIIRIDGVGNAISNIKKELFNTLFFEGNYEVFANHHRTQKIYQHYDELVFNSTAGFQQFHGLIMAMFNEFDYLQIIIYKSNLQTVGGASTLLGLKEGSEIRISKK